MNVIEALNSRYAARAFKPDPVSKETLLKIMTAATRSPSWADTQPWEIFIAGGETLNRLRRSYLERFTAGAPSQTDLARPQNWPPALQQRMAENGAYRFKIMGVDRNDENARQANNRRNYEFFGAPVVVYLCLDRTLTPWSIYDLGMVSQSIMLAAQEYGVDSMPAVGLVAYPGLLRQELGIPDDLLVMMGLALGYGDADDPVNKPRSLRRPVEEAVRFKGF